MQKSPLQFLRTVNNAAPATSAVRAHNDTDADVITVRELPRLLEVWLSDNSRRRHSPRTQELRRILITRLIWFLEQTDKTVCGPRELEDFFNYLISGHKDGERWGIAGGRWGKSGRQFSAELRPATYSTYFHHMRTFFNWLVKEEFIDQSPMAKAETPEMNSDQIRPFTTEQVKALLEATKYSKYPRRDEAIVRFLYDTGVRVSELCTLEMQNLDLVEGHANVRGKGNKSREVCFGRKTARVLRAYLREDGRTPGDPVFLSERGETNGTQLTRWGVSQIIERLGKRANIRSVRCSPHTFRHTFAIEFIRNGGQPLALRQLLGHSGLHITMRYVLLAGADMKAQHLEYGPGDRL